MVPKIRMLAFSWGNASNGSMTTSTVGTLMFARTLPLTKLQEIAFDKNLKDDAPLTPQTQSSYRSVLGQINWLQSRTQFSRRASPTIEDGHQKTVRTIKSIPLSMRFWPLHGKTRIVGYPDASYRNNEDKSYQRVIFLAEERDLRRATSNLRGSLADYETHKVATTMSTTVAELHGLVRCYGSALFLRGLWSDVTGEIVKDHSAQWVRSAKA